MFETLRVNDARLVVGIDVVSSMVRTLEIWHIVCKKFTYICWLEIFLLYKLN